MANILYGVQGEGRGHSSRSKIIIEHLHELGHSVRIFTSHKAYEYLSPIFEDVHDILGLGFVFEGSRLDIGRTIQKNLQEGSAQAGRTLKLLHRTVKEFRPDLAITDFEPFVPYVKSLYNIPFISINHQHVLSHYQLDYPYAWRGEYLKARAVVDAMYRLPEMYIVTSFFYPPVRPRYHRRSRLVGPILRREVLEQTPSRGGPVLIYVTTPEARQVLDLARGMKRDFVAYGFGRQAERDGRIEFRPPSTGGFLQDLAAADGVITNGGFSLMSEALFLGKPVYSIPIQDQFEQMCNAYYLERLGYGLYDLEPSARRLEMFLEGGAYFRRNIRRDRDRFCGNEELFRVLGESIAALTV